MTRWNNSFNQDVLHIDLLKGVHLLAPDTVGLTRGISDPGEEIWATLGRRHQEFA